MKNLSMDYQVPNPAVEEQTPHGTRQSDVFTRLLKDRIVYLATPVVPASANLIIAQMLFLEKKGPDQPIHFYINSPGGSVHDGLGIYDVMQNIKVPVHTYAIGMAASMGSLLLMAGEQGHRYAMPNANIMIHQPLLSGGGLSGQVTDIEIQAKNLVKTKEKLTQMYSLHCNQDYDKLRSIMERDYYMNGYEAKELGLIDHIIESDKLKNLKLKRGV